MNKILNRDIFFIFNRESSGYISTFFSLGNKYFHFFSLNLSVLLLGLIFGSGLTTSYSQVMNQPYYFAGNQPNNNYMANSTAFRQEIARMEINAVRLGRDPLPITDIVLQKRTICLRFAFFETG